MLDYDQLTHDFQQLPSLRLLRSQHAPLILSFCAMLWKRDQRLNVPLDEVTEKLDRTLESLNHLQPNSYPLSAAAYLKQWSDESHRFLRIVTYGRSDTPVVELTPDLERVIGWMEELYRREFVGTESRFQLILGLLDEIATRSTGSVEARLAQLEQEQARIAAEIAEIRASGAVEPYTQTQIRERFSQVNQMARQLLRDFATVEQNFREIARAVQERQLQPDARKGDVLGYVLDADVALRDSDQGRSFYAFWSFLSVPDQQDALTARLGEVFELPALQAQGTSPDPLIRRLPLFLLEAGDKIIQSNQRLAEQLRRLLDERVISERRRVRELISAIKHGALRTNTSPPVDAAWGVTVETPPEPRLSMERELWEPGGTLLVESPPPTLGAADLTDPRLAYLYQQFVVDERRLRRQLESMLAEQREVTLGEVVARYPLQQGLSEVLTYLAMATNHPHHTFSGEKQETLTLEIAEDGEPLRRLTIPQVLFRRDGGQPRSPSP